MRKVHKLNAPTPKLPTKKKVAAYARVSIETDKTLHSISAQVSYYSEYIQSNPNWEYVGVYADSGERGTGKGRGELQQLLADCEAGKIDIVLTKSISRFARNTVDLLTIVRRLKEIGVEVRFEREGISSMSGDGELMLSILASFAQEESRSLSENVKWTVRNGFKEGKPSMFHVYGYRRVDGEIEIVPEEAEVVRLVFSNFLNGIGTEETTRQLNATGLINHYGNPFHPSSVRKMLKNICYTGDIILQRYFKDDFVLKKNNGELPQYLVENHHPAIIDKETFQAVQDELAKCREIGVTVNSGRKYVLTGKIQCACGKYLYRTSRTKKAGEIVVWRCRTHRKHKDQCSFCEVPQDVIHKAVTSALGIETYSDATFTEGVSHIFMPDQFTIIIHLVSGVEVKSSWEYPPHRHNFTPEQSKEHGRLSHAGRGQGKK